MAVSGSVGSRPVPHARPGHTSHFRVVRSSGRVRGREHPSPVKTGRSLSQFNTIASFIADPRFCLGQGLLIAPTVFSFLVCVYPPAQGDIGMSASADAWRDSHASTLTKNEWRHEKDFLLTVSSSLRPNRALCRRRPAILFSESLICRLFCQDAEKVLPDPRLIPLDGR